MRLLAPICPEIVYYYNSATSILPRPTNIARYSQADHLLIQETIHQDLSHLKMVVQEVQVGQEVLEVHVSTLLEGPTKAQI
jgi:hypothetical protein